MEHDLEDVAVLAWAGVWQEAMGVLRRRVRRQHGRLPEPSMLMAYARSRTACGLVRHSVNTMAKDRLNDARWVIAIDYLGLPVGACVVGARREVGVAQDLLDELLAHVPRVRAVIEDSVVCKADCYATMM